MFKTPKLTKTLLIVAGIAAFAVPAVSVAKGQDRGPRVTFEMLDTDQSGDVTLAEMAAHGAARFTQADADGDGFLTPQEVSANAEGRRANRVERMFERRDANSDGKLSLVEMTPDEDRIVKRFARADADGNGAISKAEFDEVSKHRRGRHKRGSE